MAKQNQVTVGGVYNLQKCKHKWNNGLMVSVEEIDSEGIHCRGVVDNRKAFLVGPANLKPLPGPQRGKGSGGVVLVVEPAKPKPMFVVVGHTNGGAGSGDLFTWGPFATLEAALASVNEELAQYGPDSKWTEEDAVAVADGGKWTFVVSKVNQNWSDYV